MTDIRRRINRPLTAAERRRHAEIRRRVEGDRPRLERAALLRKGELLALGDAMRALKRERLARKISLADVAERSGIDKSRLSKLENDAWPNPTLNTITRIAEAIGVRIKIAFDKAA